MTMLLFRLGRWSARRPKLVIGLWLIAGVALIAATSAFGAEQEDSFTVPGVDSDVAAELLASAHSDRGGVTARVVATPTDGRSFADPAAAAELTDVEDAVAALPAVRAVDRVISPDQEVALLTVQYPVLEDLSAADLDRLKQALDDQRADRALQIEAGGELYFSFEQAGGGGQELIGIAAAIVVLLVAFGSVIAMGLPIVIALFGLALGIAAMPLISHLVMIPSWVPEFGTMIGLGVGIDYALFLLTRYRELLADGRPADEAAGSAVATAGHAVVVAGGTVVVAILGLGVAGVPFVTAAGIATSVIVALMVLASITLLPACLGWAGPWINRLAVRSPRHRAGAGTRWRRWGAHVARHAWAYAIGVTAALLALTAPVLALELGFPDDGTQAESRTERRAYDLAAEGFGAGINGPLLIAVDLQGDPDVVGPLADAVAVDPGIAAVAPPEIDTAAGVATLVAFPTTAPQDDATYATVTRLRDDVLPAALADSPASAHVGGQTATFGDVSERVTERLPWFVGAVIALSFLLLMVVFRSILVPLKAALMNLLSIGAAYGVLVMIFQWGWGKGLIGLETTVPIVSFVPMFMFAVLFGLSMDYEVFLLSRVREEYVATGDNDASVVSGLAGTARVITSAALIMISVFAAFVLGDDPTAKMFGLGLATAILIDATVVRVILVPATMKLLGDANWWLPAWLDRRLPHVAIDGHPTAPPADGAVVAEERVSVPG